MATRTDFPVVAIGASAGALDDVRRITEGLPRECAAAIAVVFHVGPHPSHLPEILNWHGKLPADIWGRRGHSGAWSDLRSAPGSSHAAGKSGAHPCCQRFAGS
jgi:hypothetical protein